MKIRRLLAIAALPLFFTTNALACLNDRETVAGEQEFRSRYESPANPGASAPAPPNEFELSTHTAYNGPAIIAAVIGAALIAGGIKIASKRLAPTRSAKR